MNVDMRCAIFGLYLCLICIQANLGLNWKFVGWLAEMWDPLFMVSFSSILKIFYCLCTVMCVIYLFYYFSYIQIYRPAQQTTAH